MILHDWFDWSNATVGVAGLALTAAALWQAAGAKSAAREAAAAVLGRSASEDLRGLERLASSVLSAIESEQFGLASYRSRDFIAECPKVREHHRGRLGTDGGKLDAALHTICNVSTKLQAGPGPTDLIAIINSMQIVIGDLSRLVGILSRNEEEVQ